jgi:N-acetylglucosamine-6-phosphate deacetylase
VEQLTELRNEQLELPGRARPGDLIACDRIRASYDALFDALKTILSEDAPGARIPGLHLEGPYLNPAHAGAHPPEALRLEVGALADFLVLDEDGRLCETWVGARRVYAREAGWIAAV